MSRSNLLVLLLAPSLGCFSVQAGAGPSFASPGGTGAMVTAGAGMGYSFRGHQGVFATASGGLDYDRHARGTIISRFEYVRFTDRWGLRAGLRLGPVFERTRYDLPAHTLVGASVTWLPLVHRIGDRDHDRDDDEKGGWNLPAIPDVATWYAVGLEVAVDYHQSQDEARERSYPVATLSLVGQFVSMLDK